MKRLLTFIFLLLSLTISAQRVIENPVIGGRSMGTCTGFFIDKIELSDNATKLYMTNYHGYKEGWFRIASTTTLRAGGKQWKVTSAEGIDLDVQVYPKDDVEFVTHYVLNFPAIDQTLQTVDFYETDDLNSYILYDIALTDQAAEQIRKRIAFPDALRNYALNIKDNGESLKKNDFTMTPAIVKGKIYGFEPRTFGPRMDNSITASIYNPFLAEQVSYSSKINADGTFEISVPMTTKHQVVYMMVQPIISNYVLLSAGKTVEVNFDFQEIYRPWELPNGLLIPYFAGENVDLNYALSLEVSRGIYREILDNPTAAAKVSKFTMAEYKDYVLKFFDDYSIRIDAMPLTKRAKELLRIELKSDEAYYLSMGDYWMENAYRIANGKGYRDPIPDFEKPKMDESYLDYPQLIGVDDVMMLYAHQFTYNVGGWDDCFGRVFHKSWYLDGYNEIYANTMENLPSTVKKMSKKEKPVAAVLAKKFRAADTSRTPEERKFEEKYVETLLAQIRVLKEQEDEIAKVAINKILGDGDSYFKDFVKLQSICQPLNRQTVVSDSVVREVEKMRIPFYAEYIKAKNAEIVAKIAAEKARGGYHVHKAGDSEGDSLLVDLIKDFRGKVILIDFWNTWCAPCRDAIKQMTPMKEEFEGKDVVVMYIADESSPQETYDGMIVSMKGEHYRLSERQKGSLMQKWGFTGIPSYVIIGKDGMVKDFHTGFQGVEYYKRKIEELLAQDYGKCYITGVLSDMSKGKTVVVCPSDVDVRTSNSYITATANEQGIFTCEVDADQISLYKIFLQEEFQRGMWHEGNFLVENNATVSLDYKGNRWKVVSGGPEQTLKNNLDAEAEQLFREPLRAVSGQSVEEKKISDKYAAWKRDNYKNRPILYNLYEIAEALKGSNGIDDERKAEKLEIYHTYFENFRTDNPIHNTIRMQEAAFKLQTGKPYIDFEVETVDGKRINIEPLYRGKVTLIDFWASWCGPCRKHSIALIPIYEKYKDKGFNVIAVAHEEKLSDMTRAAEKDAYPWQSYIDLNDQLKVWQKNGLGFSGGGMYLIDSNGIILSSSTNVEDLEPLIRQALGIK